MWEFKNQAGEKGAKESEACGICLTGTCLYRPVPFQFKRPLSWEQQLNIILCEEKKTPLFPPFSSLFSEPAPPTLQGRFAASVSSFVWILIIFPGLSSPAAAALSLRWEGKGSEVTKRYEGKARGTTQGWQNISLASEMLAHSNIQSSSTLDWRRRHVRPDRGYGPRPCSHLQDKAGANERSPAVDKRLDFCLG